MATLRRGLKCCPPSISSSIINVTPKGPCRKLEVSLPYTSLDALCTLHPSLRNSEHYCACQWQFLLQLQRRRGSTQDSRKSLLDVSTGVAILVPSLRAVLTNIEGPPSSFSTRGSPPASRGSSGGRISTPRALSAVFCRCTSCGQRGGFSSRAPRRSRRCCPAALGGPHGSPDSLCRRGLHRIPRRGEPRPGNPSRARILSGCSPKLRVVL